MFASSNSRESSLPRASVKQRRSTRRPSQIFRSSPSGNASRTSFLAELFPVHHKSFFPILDSHNPIPLLDTVQACIFGGSFALYGLVGLLTLLRLSQAEISVKSDLLATALDWFRSSHWWPEEFKSMITLVWSVMRVWSRWGATSNYYSKNYP